MSTRQITTEPPGLTVCSRCHAPVLAAVIGGIDRHLDPVALNREGMEQARAAGLPLYVLRGDTAYVSYWPKYDTGEPMTVLPQHTCNRPVPDRFVSAAHMEVAIHLVTKLLGAQAVDTGDSPPF